jgi:hypothetical protein
LVDFLLMHISRHYHMLRVTDKPIKQNSTIVAGLQAGMVTTKQCYLVSLGLPIINTLCNDLRFSQWWRKKSLQKGFEHKRKKKKNSVASVHKRIIPPERPPLVSEVSANFLRIEGAMWSACRIPYSRISRPEPLLLLPSSFSVVFTRLSGPLSRPNTFFL